MEAIETYIDARKELFWSVGENHKKDVKETLLVETILNYGSLEDVKGLFDLLGLQQTAAIFYKAIENRNRSNYFPQVENFFKLYFDRHAR